MNLTLDLFFSTNEKIHIILIDWGTILESVLKKNYIQRLKNLKLSKLMSRNYEKKIHIIILFVEIFLFVGKNKPGVKFVILFANFKVRGKNPTFWKFHDIRCQYPFVYICLQLYSSSHNKCHTFLFNLFHCISYLGKKFSLILI